MAVSNFVPRATFAFSESLPRSYFLGHHRAGLADMTARVSSVDLILECRDYRIPLTSRNPLFEESLVNKERIIVFTKRDLGSMSGMKDRKREQLLKKWYDPIKVVSSHSTRVHDTKEVFQLIKKHEQTHCHLMGSTIMVVGMPNVGKSTLLNALRRYGVNKGKAAQTGGQPGVTRTVGTSVKIINGFEGNEGVYILDTPGVFMPYVPDGEAMLKLALCGSVKDSIISDITLADYLLYHLNKVDPLLYAPYHSPSNNVVDLLLGVAKKTGRLSKGGKPNLEGAAQWLIEKWRKGRLGKFVLDDVTENSLHQNLENTKALTPSITQARKSFTGARKLKARTRPSSMKIDAE